MHETASQRFDAVMDRLKKDQAVLRSAGSILQAKFHDRPGASFHELAQAAVDRIEELEFQLEMRVK
jgi:hypothetical protein